MSDFPAAERILHKAVGVSAPVEDVWWAWTTDAGIRTWLVDDSRVELTQLGWGEAGEWDEAYDYFDDAWDRVLDRLRAYFAGEDGLPEA